MEAIHTGGPAFPITANNIALDGSGMTLRDYFAAKAMQAAATYPKAAEGFTFDERATWAYQQADAMLKAREA